MYLKLILLILVCVFSLVIGCQIVIMHYKAYKHLDKNTHPILRFDYLAAALSCLVFIAILFVIVKNDLFFLLQNVLI